MAYDLASHARLTREIACAHAEAFQLMLYRTEGDQPKEAWIWNSRDGVTPFLAIIDGEEYRHAIHGYPTRYTAILPAGAAYVWVSYTPASWEAQMRANWAVSSARPVPADYEGATFLDDFPTPEDYVAIRPFEHGQPRRITRAEFLAGTPEWMGKEKHQ